LNAFPICITKPAELMKWSQCVCTTCSVCKTIGCQLATHNIEPTLPETVQVNTMVRQTTDTVFA